MAAGNSSHSLSPPTTEASGQGVLVPWTRVEGFVGKLIHDVRNGLNAIELQLTFLGEISTDPEVVDEVKRLRSTLSDVTRQLQAVRSSCGPVTANVMEYPARDFFEDLYERLLRLHPEAAERVAWEVSPDPADVLLVDPDLSINGLLELFKNAFRFAGTALRCTTTSGAERISFVLQETPAAAPTIPPERWGREPLLSNHRGAYGLGLFRLRQIVQKQGGTLESVYSASEPLLTTTASFVRPPRAG